MMSSEFARRWLVLGLILIPFSLRAILFEPLSIEALTGQADLVVQGTVLSKTIGRDPAGRIYTKIDLQLIDIWKGAAASNPLLIVQGGGVLGQEQVVVSGQVQYDIGEEVVAFLVRNQRGEGVTLGLMQGKFHVWKDKSTGAKMAVSPFHGVPEAAVSRGIRLAGPARTSEEGALSLTRLKQRVQEVRR